MISFLIYAIVHCDWNQYASCFSNLLLTHLQPIILFLLAISWFRSFMPELKLEKYLRMLKPPQNWENC